MASKKINDYTIGSIIKLNLYQKGLIVPDRLYDILNSSQFDDYRTTSGPFVKIGGTLSEKEFYSLKNGDNNSNELLAEITNFNTYEEYLREREYSTVIKLIRASEISPDTLPDSTYFMLDVDKNGNLYIIGQYYNTKTKERFPIKLNDVGFFEQGNHNQAEAVAIQAGGIRIRDSICGNNCISGCRFCDFGVGAENYREGILTIEGEKNRKDYLTGLIRDLVTETQITSLFITGGNPSLDDMDKWDILLRESSKAFRDTLEENNLGEGSIDVMLTPRGKTQYVYDTPEERNIAYKKYLEYLRDTIKVNTISPNMEIWSQDDLDKFCPPNGKNMGTTKSEISHDGYLDFIKTGVEVFGKFNVRTSLIVGLTSANLQDPSQYSAYVESMKEAIHQLIHMGCYVTLSPFKAPDCQKDSQRYDSDLKSKEPSDELSMELSNYLKSKVEKYLATLPPEETEECRRNIDNSLNAHNTHNTTNLCSGQDLDFIGKKALENGRDTSIIRNIYREQNLDGHNIIPSTSGISTDDNGDR